MCEALQDLEVALGANPPLKKTLEHQLLRASERFAAGVVQWRDDREGFRAERVRDAPATGCVEAPGQEITGIRFVDHGGWYEYAVQVCVVSTGKDDRLLSAVIPTHEFEGVTAA